MALSAFEAALRDRLLKAMAKAIETAIVSAAEVQLPKGILQETPATGQALSKF